MAEAKRDGSGGGRALTAPRTRLESAIAGVWKDVLGRDDIGVDSDFFELGGESLEAVTMLAAVDEVLLAPVSFADFLDAPTVAGLAVAVAAARQRPGHAGPRPADSLDAGEAPCTFAQERLWFVDQLAGSTAAYNEAIGARVRGALDADVLDRSLAAVVARHAALRTSFAVRDGVPVQIVHDDVKLTLERIDLRGTAEPEIELASLTSERASCAFDLETAPLLRACLVTVGDDDHVVQLVFHHNICDGASHVVFLRELAALYRAGGDESAAALAPPPLQYPDFARWQRDTLTGDALDVAMAPWRERLADAPDAVALPFDRPRPSIERHRGATRRGLIDAPASAAVRALGRAEGATPFAILMTAFGVLLHRYSGQTDIVIGTATAGRDRAELAEVLGLFVNTIVLRNDVSGDPTVRELLGRARRVVLDAVAHQDAPFERLVAELQRTPDLSRHPIFQVFLALRPHATLDLPGAEPFHSALTTSRTDLTLWIEESPRGFELIWEYSTDLFDAETIERLERHFLALLASALRAPEAPISKLAMIDATERAELIAAAGEPPIDRPVACMHELFERQAALRPDATAVTFERWSMTYRELNAAANRLAHQLRGLGVGRESLVALYLERSLEMVVAILAVLKSGGAYVPLDPEHPATRSAFVLSDTGARVLLTKEGLAGRLPPHDAVVIVVDPDGEGDPGNPTPVATPDSLAYVIYTSGSTGQPKGVQVEHRHVARLFSATEQWYGFGAQDVWTLAHSYAFDVSVWELWGALAHGGRIVVCPFWVTRSPDALAALVAEQAATVLCATPSLFTSVQDELLMRADELALRFIVFAGEALQPASLRPWFERFGDDAGPDLINMYGITETTVHSTYRVIRGRDCERDSSPIGVPIPDLTLHLLDSAGEPVPVGVPGELYVGGAGVTRGYLNRDELTQARFIANPFGGGRLYRSGDVARRLPDGELEFHGRMDDQVKIRGFRIELGEIQATLRDHPAVADCAMLAVTTQAGDVRLAAYVVPDPERAAPVRELLRLLREGQLSPEEIYELPDGTEIAHVNGSEARFLFEEIVERDSYRRHGIAIPPAACVVDVGANIGMFDLLVAQQSPNARILAFEPIPSVHRVLSLNATVHGLHCVALDCAIGSASGTATFTFFPHATLMSSRYADARDDAQAVRVMLENTGELDEGDAVDELLADRLESETIERPVQRLSDVLHAHGIDRIDLLKVDAEKAELDVLGGIDDDDWPMIRQVVMEVHGGEARLRDVCAVLERAGLRTAFEEDDLLRGSGLYNVYATRGAIDVATPPSHPVWRGGGRMRRDLRLHLEHHLPEYMVPASIRLVESLPLTTNGKLDRRALPAPEWEHGREAKFVEPRTATEGSIAEVWQDVLGVERAGRDDSFFRLGGHSLLAARVVTRMRERYAIPLSVRTLFEQPTLSGFAAVVDAALAGTDRVASESTAHARLDPGGSYPLAFPQQQLLFFDELAPGNTTYNAALATRVVGPLDDGVLLEALSALYERHEALRSALVWGEDSEPVQVVQPGWTAELPLIDLSGLPEGDREARLEQLLADDALRPFDLASDLMMRATLFRLGPDEHVLLIAAHHVAFDAWSVELLYRDLSELYAALRAARSPTLPSLARRYGDFARDQRERFGGETLTEELDFWRSHLAGAPTTLRLPLDRRRGQTQSFGGASHFFELDAPLAAAVRAVARELDVTPYMVLLASFATLLYRVGGQDDILLGGPMANREAGGFDDVIGFFANTIVVRAQLAGNPTFAELLERVRESVLQSYDHQDVPFELVVNALRPARDPGINPVVQVNFRVRVGAPAKLELAGTQTNPVPVDLGFARFDLALELHLLEDRIAGELIYNTALFDESTVVHLARELEALLRRAVAEPATRLLSFPVSARASTTAASGIRGFRRSGT